GDQELADPVLADQSPYYAGTERDPVVSHIHDPRIEGLDAFAEASVGEEVVLAAGPEVPQPRHGRHRGTEVAEVTDGRRPVELRDGRERRVPAGICVA